MGKKTQRKNAKDKPVVIKTRDGYKNTITGKYVSEAYAKRLNSYFRRNPDAVLSQATGHSYYTKEVSWSELSGSIRKKAFNKGTQLIRTYNRKGAIKYYSPFLKKVLTDKEVKKIQNLKLDYKICNGKVLVELFRVTRDYEKIYHVYTWPINQKLSSSNSIEFFRPKAMLIYNSILMNMKRVLKKYKFGSYTIAYGHINCYFYSKIDGWESGRTFGFVLPNKSGYEILVERFNDMLDFYKNKLEIDAYHNIVIQTVTMYIFDFKENAPLWMQKISEYRQGVLRVEK